MSDVECHSWFSSSGFSFALSPGTRRSGGCIVLYRPVLNLVNFWCEVPGRSLMCEFSFHDATFRVLCLYAPNRNPARDLFFNSISDAVDPSIPTVLCGDLNTVFDHALDRFGSSADDTSRESTLPLTRVVLRISGGTFIQPLQAFPGTGGMASWHLALTWLASHILGFLLCRPVTFSPFLPLIIVLCCFLSPFLMSSPLVQVYGN